MGRVVVVLIGFYQYAISPMMAGRCRYFPSCSQYAVEAITHHGVVKGGFLAVKRLLNCHPWSQSGYDPVPGTDVHATDRNPCCELTDQTHSPNPTER